jgi:hypothetical protein
MSSFVVLGVHDEYVDTIEGNYLRARMTVGNKEIDEDFILPELPRSSGIPRTLEVYRYLLKDDIEKRMAELENKLTDSSKSLVDSLEKSQVEQSITEIKK